MGRKRQSIIGFSQTIKMSWMDFTADQVIRNVPPGDIQLALDELLREELSVNSSAKRGDRQKAISILLRIWARPGRSMKCFRDDGLRLFSKMPSVFRGCIDYGMTISVYPFVSVVAQTLGRLFRLQGYATTAEAQRRLKELYGPRSTVARGTNKVLKSFMDWGFISQESGTGIFRPRTPTVLSGPAEVSWLLEAMLHSSESGSGLLQSLLSSPVLFPFRVDFQNGKPPKMSDRVEITPHGWDDFILRLKDFSCSLE